MIVGGLWEKEKQTTNQQIFSQKKKKKKNEGLNQKRLLKQTQYEERQGETPVCNRPRSKQDSNRQEQEEKNRRHWRVQG